MISRRIWPFLFFLTILAMLSPSSWAAEKSSEERTPSPQVCAEETKSAVSNPAFEISLSVDDVPEYLRETVRRLFSTALGIVRALPPYGNQVFDWKDDREKLERKTLDFIVTTRAGAAEILKLANSISKSGSLPDQADAFTAGAIRKGEWMKIYSFFFYEKLFFDAQGNELPDEMARLIVALAHEIYGNVQAYCLMDLDDPPPSSAEMRKIQERRAFKAGIDFLERFKKSPAYKDLDLKIRKDLDLALERERRGLKTWR